MVKVLTGDNELVTAKICREVGLEQQGYCWVTTSNV
jgi:magnesium-transporting ATPase (P-type)